MALPKLFTQISFVHPFLFILKTIKALYKANFFLKSHLYIKLLLLEAYFLKNIGKNLYRRPIYPTLCLCNAKVLISP